MSSDVRISTGQSDFSFGVDSSRTPLVQSQANPDGLPRNGLAWLVNGATRGGGIAPRYGWKPLVRVHDGNALYQGGIMYDSYLTGGNPYLLLSIGGRMYQVRVDTDNSVIDITGANQDPPLVPKAYFTQGEQFVVKQAGDGKTLPLFWDGFTLRRSLGNQFSEGVTSAPFTSPAVGVGVLVTLTAPYAGAVNQALQVWDPSMLPNPAFQKYIQVVPGNFFTIKNIAGSPGVIVPGGTPVKFTDGSTQGVLLAQFTIPAVGATVNVKVAPTYTGALPVNVTINGAAFEIDTVGAAAPGANQVYLVNLNDTPGNVIPTSTVLYGTRELPAAQSMVYYMGRIWYSQNRKYTAGDIVSGPSGTVQYNNTDSILKVTENPLALAGDGFSVPGQAGNIRALSYPISLDTALGQGPLFAFTTKQIYALDVPVTRTAWIAADSNNQPLQRVVQRVNGTVSDRSIVPVNSDLFFQSLDPAIRTFSMSVRYTSAGSWQNPPVSNNINRVMNFNDRSLMHMSSGMEFGSRMYQTVIPVNTPVGIAFQALAVMDLDPVSTLQNQKPPVWDGISGGLDIMQLFSGDFGGLERGFAVVHNRIDGAIWIWELSSANKFDASEDGTENRIEYFFETPAMDWSEYPRQLGGGIFELKELDGLDIWMDRIFGEVLITVQFRPDEDSCWYDWAQTMVCAARTCSEDPTTPICYPDGPRSEQYRIPISFPKPTNSECSIGNDRPVTWGTKFQLKITVKGYGRVRGYALHALAKDSGPYYHQVCKTL